MELSATSRFVSGVPKHRSFNSNFSFVPSTWSFSRRANLASMKKSGLIYFVSPLPRAATSEETSTSISRQSENVHDEEMSYEESSFDARTQFMKFFAELNGQLGNLDPFPAVLYGSSVLAALWISSAIAAAIDSIPVIPKFLEVVGFGFTIWFIYRYLIFKKNRKELFSKIEQIRQDIIGSDDD